MSDSLACRVSLGPWMPNQLGAEMVPVSLCTVSVLFCIWNGPIAVAHGKLQRHLVESVSLYNWERHGWVCISMIWDGFVTSPIKHDQLNIFALNVCHRAPAWMGQTAKKLWSWFQKGITEKSYYFWVVMGEKLLSVRLSGATFLCQPSFPCIPK